MQTISVYLQREKPTDYEAFRAIVQKLKSQVNTYPVTIDWREQVDKDCHAFVFQSWSDQEYTLETRDIVRAFVSLVIVEWIIRVVEPEFVQRYVSRDSLLEEEAELWQILPYVKRILDDSPDQGEWPIDKAVTRRAKLYRKTFEFLQENREIILRGFARFRLKDYWNHLFEAVDAGIDEYLEEKQYQEFVELLRYFISHQETKYEVVHIVPAAAKFLLYDQEGQPIQLDQLDAVFSLGEQKCREEDYLISALVTLAPKKIVFHLAEEKQALSQTINGIFENRLVCCTSCAYCLTNRRPLDVNKPTHL